MHQAVSEYLLHLEARFYSRTHQYNACLYLGRLIAYLKDRYPSREPLVWQVVSERHLIAFATWAAHEYRTRKGNPITSATLTRWLSCIRSFFNWMQKASHLLHNPAVSLFVPIIGISIPKILSEDQMVRLIEMPDLSTLTGLRDRALMELLYATGLRKSESVGLDLYDMDIHTEQVFVRCGKGKKDRVVPLTAQACHWLSRYLTEVRPRLSWQSGRSGRTTYRARCPSSAFFLSQHGRRLTGGSMAFLVSRYAKRAKVFATLHTFRHCFATHLLQRGASIRMVQKLLGHKSLDVTERYTHLNVSDLKTAIKSSFDLAGVAPLCSQQSKSVLLSY